MNYQLVIHYDHKKQSKWKCFANSKQSANEDTKDQNANSAHFFISFLPITVFKSISMITTFAMLVAIRLGMAFLTVGSGFECQFRLLECR